MKIERKAKHIIAVGGGKGGVGKSVCSAALAYAISQRGYKTVLGDFDLGAANLHTYLGLNPSRTLIDFLHKKVDSFDDVIVPTGFDNLFFMSGGDYSFGAANPAHWMKMKVMRHIHAIDADFVIMDLGAGTSYNVLDLFGTADRGIVVTVPEPGAIINAYAFLKGALFRKIQNVFGRHPEIGPYIENLINSDDPQSTFSLPVFREAIEKFDSELVPVVDEVGDWFRPFLLVNMAKDEDHSILVENLERLCSRNLGVTLKELTVVPSSTSVSRYLINMLDYFSSQASLCFMDRIGFAVDTLVEELCPKQEAALEEVPGELERNSEISSRNLRTDFDDDILEKLQDLIDSLDEMIFMGSSRELMKCRLFFKPGKVVEALAEMGIEDEILFQ